MGMDLGEVFGRNAGGKTAIGLGHSKPRSSTKAVKLHHTHIYLGLSNSTICGTPFKVLSLVAPILIK